MASSSLPRITVLGSLNIDLVSYVPHHPLPGETLTSTSFAVSPGGKGANQAVACAKLSRARDHASNLSSSSTTAIVSMAGTVGHDAHGTLLLDNLTSHGVDTSHVHRSPSDPTGTAIIIVDEPSGQNRIILAPGANHFSPSTNLSQTTSPPSSEPRSEIPTPKPDLLVMQLEIPLPRVLSALSTAKSTSTPVLLNPAPAQPLPPEAYQNLSHLVVNETEASILSSYPESELDHLPGLRRVGDWFLERGVHTVIITLGGRGVYYADQKGRSAFVDAEKADVVDTTAAGDTFVGSYCISVVTAAKEGKEFDIGEAIARANKAAAKTVERKGAQDSIPWRDELE